MKLSFRDRLKVLMTGNIEDYRKAFLSGEDISVAGDVDAEVALKYSAVFGCCRVLAETFASAPLMLYQRDGKDRVPFSEIKSPSDEAFMLYEAMHNRPNEEMSAFNCFEAMSMSINLGGNAVCEKLINARGEVVGIYPYPQSMVKIDRDKDTKKLVYTITGKTDRKTLSRSQVLHIPGPSLDGIIGLSPISYASQAIRLGLSYEKFGVNFYENAASPSGVFKHPGTLTEPAYDRLKKSLRSEYTGLKNTGVPMLLEEGMDWKQLTINPIDAQLLESKYFQIEDICRIYRVPQHLLNKLDRSTNNNIEHQSLEFVMYTMLPIYKRAEACENAQLISTALRKQGYFLEHKIDGLLRGDSEARAKLYANGRQWGWMSANDIRKLENLPSLGPEGDIYLQPTNMIEAGSDGGNAVNARLVEDIYNMITERGKAV